MPEFTSTSPPAKPRLASLAETPGRTGRAVELRELPTATDKARRDAGDVQVTRLGWH